MMPLVPIPISLCCATNTGSVASSRLAGGSDAWQPLWPLGEMALPATFMPMPVGDAFNQTVLLIVTKGFSQQATGGGGWLVDLPCAGPTHIQ